MSVHRVWKFGPEIDTDALAPGAYMKLGIEGIAPHCLEAVRPEFAGEVQPGAVIAAGPNFGIGSSREQAVHVMHRMGVAAIIAPSFGRQFYRNAINNGMPVIECDISGIAAGDELEIDLVAGRVAVPSKNMALAVPALPGAVRALLESGGLIPFLQKHPDWNLGAEAA